MAVLFASWWTELAFTICAGLVLFYVYFKTVSSRFFESRGIAHLPPVFLLGNMWKASITDNFAFLLADMYDNWKDKKMVGFWTFHNPALLVTDLDIIKNVLTRDFGHFRDRGMKIDFHRDPLAGNLFNVSGAKWRNLRVKLTPTFTSGKMKMMFPTMVECGEELQEYLKKIAKADNSVDVKEILSRFTTDIISSCAFGIKTNSLNNPDSEFRKYGKKIFQVDLDNVVRGLIFNFSPFLFNLLRLRFTPKDVTDFFLAAVRDTMEYREKNRVTRNDFLELLIQLKNKGKLDDVDEAEDAVADTDPEPVEDMKFGFNEAAAQAFVFFAAGFETSSTTLTFALYELALNQDIQKTLRNEIKQVLEKYQNKVTYECIREMNYLDWIVQETLRKYPPVPFLFRLCNKEYEIPEFKVKIPKELVLMIPVLAIQRDPEHFPEPDKFDPLRYSPEGKEKRHHFATLPFGEGPRNCIGNRFGLLQTKVGLVSILSKFEVGVAKDTQVPLKYDSRSFVLAPKGGMPLKFKMV